MGPPTTDRRSPCTRTATVIPNSPPPHYTGDFDNPPLLATFSRTDLLANLTDTIGAQSHQTITLNCHAEVLPSNAMLTPST